MGTPKAKTPIERACENACGSINRAFIVTQFIKESLDELHAQVKQRKKKRLRISIPSYSGGLTEIFGTKEEIQRILEESLTTTIYQQAFISSVSTVEDCIMSCLRESLKAHPQKLSLSIEGEKIDKVVALDTVVSASSLDSLIDGLIATRILKVMYDRPVNYFRHLKAIANIDLKPAIQGRFVEVKASRDVFVHNQSIINNLYIEKSGKLARGGVNEKLPIDEAYFQGSMALMKEVVIEIYKTTK